MFMNLQTLELFPQALKGDCCFYVCDLYLLSYGGKFPLFKNVFDLPLAVRRRGHAASSQTARERDRRDMNDSLILLLSKS